MGTIAARTYRWGRSVVRTEVEGHPCLVYAERRHHVAELLAEARRWADRTHIVHGERRISFAAVEAGAHRVAARLRGLGVAPGDRVALLAANSPEWVVAFWGAVQLGSLPVLANAWWSKSEVHDAIDLVEPAMVFTDARRQALLPANTNVIEIDSLREDVDATGEAAPVQPPAASEHDPAVILFTSGTVGAPKGAILSHRAVIANLHNMLLTTRRLPSDLPDDEPGRTYLMSLPLFHLGGLTTIGSQLLTGGTMVFLSSRFDPAEVLRLIEAERVRTWGGVPTMIARVVEHPDLAIRDTSSLRTINMGGASFSAQLVQRTREAFPSVRRSVGTVYGLTEAGGALTVVTGDDLANHPGCVGRALPVVELRIEAPDAGGVGEILARSPACMSGYWRQADSPLDADGWLRTGDLGRLDADGVLFVAGRSKDIIIRGGENIAALNVETRLMEHPDVEAAAVVGLPDPDLGEVVAAVIVPRSGSALTPEALQAFAAERLARFEVPSRWCFVNELPTNAAGKVVKRQLVQGWPSTDPAGKHGDGE